MCDNRSRAVLSLVLAEYPIQLTICEIAREISGNDAAERVRDLEGIGLLRCEGASVLPTRAAVHFDRLAI
jgi:hypothetical protein